MFYIIHVQFPKNHGIVSNNSIDNLFFFLIGRCEILQEWHIQLFLHKE